MPRRSTKKFDFGTDVYYFNVKNGFNNNITIKRKTKKDAIQTYQQYVRTKKDCEWLGRWNGSEFEESVIDELINSN